MYLALFYPGQWATYYSNRRPRLRSMRSNASLPWHTMNTRTSSQKGSLLCIVCKGESISDIKGQAWRRNPSGKPTHEEGTRTAGLFPSQWLLEKGLGSLTIPVPFLFLLRLTPLLLPPPHPQLQSPGWPTSWPPNQGKGKGEDSPGQQQLVSWQRDL